MGRSTAATLVAATSLLLLARPSLADPETVDGLYLTKRGPGGGVPPSPQGAPPSPPPPAAVLPSAPPSASRTDARVLAAGAGGKVDPRQGGGPFRQGWFSSGGGHHAFENYLKPPQKDLRWHREQQRLKQLQQQQQGSLTFPNQFQQRYRLPPQYGPPKNARHNPAFPSRPPPPSPPSPPPTPKVLGQRQGNSLGRPVRLNQIQAQTPGPRVTLKAPGKSKGKTAATATTTTAAAGRRTSEAATRHATSTTAAPSTGIPAAEGAASAPAVPPRAPEKKAEAPRAAPLRASSSLDGAAGFTGEDRHKALLGLVIGVAFVAVFLAVAVGLAAGRLRQLRPGGADSPGGVLSSMLRSPNDEDRTPPELRGCGGPPSFVQPDGSGDLGGGRGRRKGNKARRDNCNGQDFFTGQLILHEAKRTANAATSTAQSSSSAAATTCLLTGGGNHMTSSLAAAQAAVMMPSPAEQVTDVLVSPKYDDEEEDDEEEDSDDTVYECPGLAAPGVGMVVSNPFYLQAADHLPRAAGDPKPISSQSSIFHHGIKGVN